MVHRQTRPFAFDDVTDDLTTYWYYFSCELYRYNIKKVLKKSPLASSFLCFVGGGTKPFYVLLLALGRRYVAVMLDEAHERTIHTDVLFGLLKVKYHVPYEKAVPGRIRQPL